MKGLARLVTLASAEPDLAAGLPELLDIPLASHLPTESSPRLGVKLGADLLQSDRLAARDLLARDLDRGLLLFGDRLVVQRGIVKRADDSVGAGVEQTQRLGGLVLGQALHA